MNKVDRGNHAAAGETARRRLDALDAVLFDLDGVLTRTDKIHAAAWKQLFDTVLKARAAGGDWTPFCLPDDYLRYLDGKPRYDGVRSFLTARGIALPEGEPGDPPGDDTICAVGNRKDALFTEVLGRDGIEIFDGSVKLLRALRRSGTRVACVSSSRNTKPVLRRAGLLDEFDAVVDGLDLEQHKLAGKPAPDTFLEGARRLGVAPKRAAVIEDAVAGVASGHAGGFGLVIGIDRGVGEAALREAGAHLVLRDLEEALGPPSGAG